MCADFDNLCLCPICAAYEMDCGREMCYSCSQQKAIDESDWSPVICPECKSSLVIQHDWRKPIFVCELCNHKFTDPDGEWIDSEY